MPERWMLGRQPSDREKQALYRARDALKLKSTDAVWLLLMALQHYETLYEQVPAQIATAAREVTKAVRAAAEAEATAAQEATRKAFMGGSPRSGCQVRHRRHASSGREMGERGREHYRRQPARGRIDRVQPRSGAETFLADCAKKS
ncbi:MAG TPA: hypothetical protein VG838_10550 [Opitutaceae bacterium]|nr:hypothetical protein [Opitutaceae bacterium]